MQIIFDIIQETAFSTMLTLWHIFVLHFIGDFILQPRVIADAKHNNVFMLLLHCTLYTIPFLISISLLSIEFILVTFCLHFLVDFVSSKLTHRFANEKRWYEFFTILGWDQLMHATCLIATFMFYWKDIILR